MSEVGGSRKERIGEVVSNRMQKTITVRVLNTMHHRKYNKIIKKYSKFKVHDEKNTAKIGDKVRIVETRPLSKDKRWKLTEVIK